VELFVDRARAVRPDFALTAANAGSVAGICRLLEGLPLAIELAIELAAARTRLLDPKLLLARLSMSLDALGTAPVDAPERQRTLRATVDWSIGLLDPAERSLLESVAVFVDGCTVPAAAEVAAADEDRALDLTEALIRHSLVVVEVTDAGSRCRMLSPIRAFVAERLGACPDTEDIGRRHAEWFGRLAAQADLPLRGIHQNVWPDRLQVEAANIKAAVRWYLDHDMRPLPHLFRVLSLFWILRDHLAEAHMWVDQVLPIADSLEPLPRVELLWSAAIVITDVGDDAATPPARQRLIPVREAHRRYGPLPVRTVRTDNGGFVGDRGRR
jgi:predicted ATPase